MKISNMYFNTILAIVGISFLSSFSVISAESITPTDMSTLSKVEVQTTVQQAPKLTGKWKSISSTKSALAHGLKEYTKITYITPVIYDFSTPNVLKRTQNGSVETYKYKRVKDMITIYWDDEDMGHGDGSEYKITGSGNKLVLHRELPAQAPSYYKIDITLEAVK